MRQIILDTETTGLRHTDGHRVIEIGCVELMNRKLTGNVYHQYICPEREVDEGAYAVHGLDNAFLSDKPVFAEIVDDFLQFVQGDTLVIHNAPFDVGFLNAELQLLEGNRKPIDVLCKVTDTLIMARRKHPGQRNSLDALCQRYQIDRSHRTYHGALLDAELLAKVYLGLTGGQGQLFGGASSAAPSYHAATPQAVVQEAIDVPVQLATAEEKAAHAAWLKKLKESAGQHFFAEED